MSPSPARDATSLFRSRFGSHPTVGASAPGRVNLIGEHIDYNGGPVLPCALRRRIAVMAGPSPVWEFVSALDGTVVRHDPAAGLRGDWSDYLTGVLRVLARRDAAPPVARISVASDLPAGAGLSSSAALCVAAVKALAALAGVRARPAEIAEWAWEAEHFEVGVHCGRMDQTVAVHARAGTALLFETATGTLTQVPMGERLWIVETGVAHTLREGGYNQRRRECEEAVALLRERGWSIERLAEVPPERLFEAERVLPPPLGRRVRHVVGETMRTREAADRLRRGDIPGVGRLLVEGHESLRDSYESSCPEADFLVEQAVALGSRGARLTGGGWGGAVLVLAPPERERRILAALGETFAGRFGRTPSIWWSRAGAGVRRERAD